MPPHDTPVVAVGVDGSPASERALHWADRMATAAHGSLRVITAWDRVIAYGPSAVVSDEGNEDDARALQRRALHRVRLPDDRVDARIARGSASHVLARESADVDVLVVGSDGHHPIASMLLGSVASSCVRHAVPTVVIVR